MPWRRYDYAELLIPTGADYIEVNLYYQTTSREYIEFLRDEINGTGNLTLNGTGKGGDPAYIAQSDPFFSGLAAWGDTIWQLWTHNKGVDGAAPFLMAQATVGTQQGCDTLFPESLSATSGHTQVTLEWSAVSGATGYKVYYDQAGKAQLIHDTLNDLDPLVTTLTDTGLTNGIEYCYKVTAYADMACESGYSNIVCAIPTNQGQTSTPAGVSSLTTGIISGKGNNTSFSEQTEFWPGDTISIQALVWDELNNIVLPDATVELLVTGPESFTIVSGLSDSSGVALAEWNTNVCGDYYPVVLNILIRKISRKGGS